jgi:hypothetical protein
MEKYQIVITVDFEAGSLEDALKEAASLEDYLSACGGVNVVDVSVDKKGSVNK